ncbi:MAG: TlpA disulfide reductase family protein [Gammaproteobacteria bacterium]
MCRVWYLIFLACLALASSVSFADPPRTLQIGERLYESTLQGLNGPTRKLSEFRGKPLIINVWASWCGPCREEMASLERLAWHDRDHRFAIIGISTDDGAEQAQTLLKNSNATISQFIDTALQMETMLGATRLPLTVLVDADGRILKKIYGARQWDGAEAIRLIDDTFGKKIARVAADGDLIFPWVRPI